MTAQAVFEELRFVWELLGAELIFLFPFAKPKRHLSLRVAACFVGFSLLAMGYFLVLRLSPWLWEWMFQGVVCAWYIFLALLTLFFQRFCFSLSVSNALYICITGYAAQHLVYTPVHQVLVLSVWPGLASNLPLYLLVSLLGCAVIYTPLFFIFGPKLSRCGGRLFRDSPAVTLNYVLLLVVLMACTFLCQDIFQGGGRQAHVGAAVDGLSCILILGIQYASLRMALTMLEQAVIQQALRSSESRYALSKELIELANRSCHDLKHSLRSLHLAGEEERQAFLRETEETIRLYEKYIPSNNPVLNAILAEKALFCERHQVTLSCAVGDVDLSFLSVPDLSILLGNAIDNAVEGAARLADPGDRVVSLSIQRRYAFLSIQTNNRCLQTPELHGGLPRTTKAPGGLHGYGLKSIRYIAAKYGGNAQISVADRIFTLQIMLPIPSEKLADITKKQADF